MSKEAAVRALRETRYQARATGTSALRKAPRLQAPPGSKQEATAAAPLDDLCGHRSMNGRTCTREHGHAAKSHRYS